MLVKATAIGFYAGKRFREGDVFEVDKGAKSKWFESLDGENKPQAEKKTRGSKQVVEPVEVEAPAVEEAPVEAEVSVEAEATETVSE
jgi:hypothetical protein